MRRLVRQVPVVLAIGLTATSCPAHSLSPTIEVSGHAVAATGVVTVDDALRRAKVVVPAGHVLAAVSHRPLAGDREPGQVLLDGLPAAGDSLVPPGAVLTVVPGKDVTEPLRVVDEPVPLAVASLYVGGHPGTAQVVRGALSGETVSRRVVMQPQRGHLVAPRAMALTFDDGPDPVWTPRILSVLAKWHVHATFCLIGRQVARHPELVRAIVKGGHTLCNHTWSHDEQLAGRTPGRIRAEIARTQDAIRRAVGITPVLFRMPGGRWSAGIEREARRQGLTPLMWNVDPRDWTRPPPKRIASAVMHHLRPGAIVLLHDGGGGRLGTAQALVILLKLLPKQHWSFQVPRP